jgi:hypothetical protein
MKRISHGLVLVSLTLSFAPSAQAQKYPDPAKLDFKDGTNAIPDFQTYQKLSYQGPEVMVDVGLKGVEFVKYQIEAVETDKPIMYFINTNTHRGHPMFMREVGITRLGRGGPGRGGPGRGGPGRGGPGRGEPGRESTALVSQMRGVLAYRPFLMAPNGEPGLFTIEYEPNDSYEYKHVKMSIDMLGKLAPFTKGKIAYYPLPRAKAQYERDKELYDKANIPSFFPEDVYKDIVFLPLNAAEGYGRLRLMKSDERPGPRDVVLYPTLPNEMPRVAGIITAVRQTPLSHVNLRAIQDGVPNAFLKGATTQKSITRLLGKYVFYKVSPGGYELKEASSKDVDKHFAKIRPTKTQTPVRDLQSQEIRALDDVNFKDSKSVGVKAANLAALRRLGFPEETVPDGFAVPFWFYDEFMKHNGFYAKAKAMMADPTFSEDTDKRIKALKKFRQQIGAGEMPPSLGAALAKVQETFGERPIRCRSSTNNEDLPGFSGAGLYGSYTHRKAEGHISKSIQQVYASLWNFRAFEERDFYRIDHATTAMGALLHHNFENEQANGVAVSDDILYQSGSKYYVNTQVGEDLVTNPNADSIPEEMLLSPISSRDDTLITFSNQVEGKKGILSRAHTDQIRKHLGRIKRKFRRHYGHKRSQGKFAMEIEFKVTADGDLVIKQARPWVY